MSRKRQTVKRERFELYFSAEALAEKVRLLNALGNEVRGWRLVCARKDHEDWFGDKINCGDYYYKFEQLPYYGDHKLSFLSMARLCWILFDTADLLEPLASELSLNREEKMRNSLRDAITKLGTAGQSTDHTP